MIEGTIYDVSDGKILPYVHIGIKGTHLGTISKDDGTFSMEVDKDKQSSLLYLSLLGYGDTEIPISRMLNQKVRIAMTPAPLKLNEVVVSNEGQKFKKVKVGNTNKTSTLTGKSGEEEFGWGGEWGILIPKQKNEFKINSVQFHLKHNTVDSILFRVHIHQLKGDSEPIESNLLYSNYITSQKNNKWVTADLSERNLWIDSDIAVTFEWVRIWYSKEGQNLIFFSNAKKGSGYPVIHRDNSFGVWHINKRPPPVIYINGIQ